MRISQFTYLLAIASLLPIQSLRAQTQTDFNGDEISDVLAATTSTSIAWTSTPSGGSGTAISETFGRSTDALVPGHWVNDSSTFLGLIRADGSNRLVWKISLGNSLQEARTFGRLGDVAIAGGDFDGNGISDAALVRSAGGKLNWSIRYNIFSSPVRNKTVSCGIANNRAFFLNPHGDRDWAAAFGRDARGRTTLTMCDTKSRARIVKHGFAKNLTRGSRPRPFPVAQEDGTDLVAFVTDDGIDTTQIRIYSSAGSSVFSRTFTGIGNVFVGNFLEDEPGEEVVFVPGSQMIIMNPTSEAIESETAPSGTAIDEVNIVATFLPTPAPTASPTATATPEPTVD